MLRFLRPARLAVRALSTAAAKPVTPDFTTSVNVHEHRLPKLNKSPPPRAWDGLQGLQDRTRGSLIPSTLDTLSKDGTPVLTKQQLKEEEVKRRRRLDGFPSFAEFLQTKGMSMEKNMGRKAPRVLQLNIGLYCNQACNHCHVEASPKRTEHMTRNVADKALELLRNSPSVDTLDLTGGAPELCREFRYLVSEARKISPTLKIIDRCNLTVLLEPGQEDLVDFLVANRVSVVASLPCYGPKNVNQQRGSGVFDKSIQALLNLNARGYGTDPNLTIDLVYNPLGGFLPPEQKKLELKYKEEMKEVFGIVFNSLYTITNMPIKRFADFLYRRGELEKYMELLVRNFNPSAVDGLMCRDHVSVRWDGVVFDCDFNNQIDLNIDPTPLKGPNAAPLTLFDLKTLSDLQKCGIATLPHCFGCTAGMGSSCGGATA